MVSHLSATTTTVLTQEMTSQVPVYSFLLRVPQHKTREQQVETLLKTLLDSVKLLGVFTADSIASWETQFQVAFETTSTGTLTASGRLKASIHLCYLLTEMIYPAAASFTDKTLQESESQIKKILELTKPDGITVDAFLQQFMDHADEAVTFFQKDEIQAKALREEELKMIRHAETTSVSLQTVYNKHKEGLLALEESISKKTAKVHKAVDALNVHSAVATDALLGLAKESQQVATRTAHVKAESKKAIASAKQLMDRI